MTRIIVSILITFLKIQIVSLHERLTQLVESINNYVSQLTLFVIAEGIVYVCIFAIQVFLPESTKIPRMDVMLRVISAFIAYSTLFYHLISVHKKVSLYSNIFQKMHAY
jgi:hypothetical protein